MDRILDNRIFGRMHWVSGRIFYRMLDIWSNIRPYTGYLVEYLAVYWISGRICCHILDIWSNIRTYTRYLVEYDATYWISGRIFGLIPDIWPNISQDTGKYGFKNLVERLSDQIVNFF